MDCTCIISYDSPGPELVCPLAAQEFIRNRGQRLPVEVECSSLPEVEQVLHLLRQPGCCVTRIMLDNMAMYDASLPGVPAPPHPPPAPSSCRPPALRCLLHLNACREHFFFGISTVCEPIAFAASTAPGSQHRGDWSGR